MELGTIFAMVAMTVLAIGMMYLESWLHKRKTNKKKNNRQTNTQKKEGNK